MLKEKVLSFMTLTEEDKAELSRYRMSKAESLLTDAELLLKSNSFESAVNRAYYAVLLATRALLILRGIDPETHEGAKTMLSKEFIKTGLLQKEAGETFRLIQARRVDSDYGDYIEIDASEAADSLNRAKEFVSKAKQAQKGIFKE